MGLFSSDEKETFLLAKGETEDQKAYLSGLGSTLSITQATLEARNTELQELMSQITEQNESIQRTSAGLTIDRGVLSEVERLAQNITSPTYDYDSGPGSLNHSKNRLSELGFYFYNNNYDGGNQFFSSKQVDAKYYSDGGEGNYGGNQYRARNDAYTYSNGRWTTPEGQAGRTDLIERYNSLLTQQRNQLALFNQTAGDYNIGKEEYNRLLKEYGVALGEFKKAVLVEKIISSNVEAPDWRDKNQWLAGGTLLGESFPGGSMYSPTMNTLYGDKPTNDFGSKAVSGEIANSLNTGFLAVQSMIDVYGFLDMVEDRKKRTTRVVRITIALDGHRYVEKDIIIDSERDESSGTDDYTFDTGGKSSSMEELGETLSFADNSAPMMSLIDSLVQVRGAGFLAMTLYDYLTGEEITAGRRLGNMVVSEVTGAFANQIGFTVISKLGITSPFAAIPIMGVVMAGVGELFEMAAGYDISFGFGGEYAGAFNGKNVYEAPVGFGRGFTDLFGFTEPANEYTDASKNAMSVAMDYNGNFNSIAPGTQYDKAFNDNLLLGDFGGNFESTAEAGVFDGWYAEAEAYAQQAYEATVESWGIGLSDQEQASFDSYFAAKEYASNEESRDSGTMENMSGEIGSDEEEEG